MHGYAALARLPKPPADMLRFFNRNSYYSIHGRDAQTVAAEYFRSAACVKYAGDERTEKLRDALTSDYVLTAKAGTAVVPPKDKKTFNDAREAQDKVRPAEVDVVAFAITLATKKGTAKSRARIAALSIGAPV